MSTSAPLEYAMEPAIPLRTTEPSGAGAYHDRRRSPAYHDSEARDSNDSAVLVLPGFNVLAKQWAPYPIAPPPTPCDLPAHSGHLDAAENSPYVDGTLGSTQARTRTEASTVTAPDGQPSPCLVPYSVSPVPTPLSVVGAGKALTP
ncbi:hypothetical protein [Streptomyces albipurpureus]|uniref:Uncharacterized protein n=1 Tax=Streptomyces albipurpureus TaxID=2897419 RepID=A0ABT0UPV7_9ACTN|nr:hypothetical protein [Streptomyces sp. CWNU-1]MCM2390494.1 hypothetical protein [Streptomyces sp. CWNU-1]